MTVVKKETVLEATNIDLHYGLTQALYGVDMSVDEEEIVALLGPNGAGKTSLMYAIMGVSLITKGRISFNGQPIHNLSTEQIARLGITLVPEGRLLFDNMTTLENLELGAYGWHRKEKKKEIRARINGVFELFPALQGKKEKIVSTLSGGQQQMVAIGRGLMSQPKLLLLDEPSLGLAPLLVRELMVTLARLKEQGLTVLLSEQNAVAALSIADCGYVMAGGKIVMEGSCEKLSSIDKIRAAYLGNVCK